VEAAEAAAPAISPRASVRLVLCRPTLPVLPSLQLLRPGHARRDGRDPATVEGIVTNIRIRQGLAAVT
jgi:hypothetical protein